ncbi:phosphoglycerate kinase [Candidatus Kaiserbacteria bacterium]|nr:phosphoglycerate kinase [Candidatus Kaiserbacteria bacterium]
MLRSIETLSDVRGLRVLLRASFDVPVKGGEVQDGFRLDDALPTIAFLAARGAKVVLIGHIGRDPMNSMRPVFDYLKKKIQLSFVEDVIGPRAHDAVRALKDGEVILLENLRRHPGEKANDPKFARELASLADIYVDDAFTVAHRLDASVVGVPLLMPSYAGLRLIKEVTNLTPALTPESPSLAIVGGAKLETKIVLLRSLLAKYDQVFVGGALVNDFYVAKGYEVGKSLVSGSNDAKELISNSKIIIPDTVVVSNANGHSVKKASEVGKEDMILDIYPSSIDALKPIADKARTILWNGPMGNFEGGFAKGTDAVAKLVASAKGRTIVGGGDTLASIQNLGLMDKFTFVSTAGGAMLDFLAHGTLPGIQALEASKPL